MGQYGCRPSSLERNLGFQDQEEPADQRDLGRHRGPTVSGSFFATEAALVGAAERDQVAETKAEEEPHFAGKLNVEKSFYLQPVLVSFLMIDECSSVFFIIFQFKVLIGFCSPVRTFECLPLCFSLNVRFFNQLLRSCSYYFRVSVSVHLDRSCYFHSES